MVTSCSVHLCTNRHSTNAVRKIHFFSFPLKDAERNELWIKAVGRKGFIPSKYSKVCSDHFLQTDFPQIVGGISYKLKLKSNAVPSIFPSYSKHVSQLKIPEREAIEPITPDSTSLSNTTNLTSSTIIPSSNNPDLPIMITPKKSVICSRPLFVASPKDKKHSPSKFELKVKIKRLQQTIRRQNTSLTNLKDLSKDFRKNVSYKVKQIISEHNKSLKITSDMVIKVDDYWLVNSETEVNVQYKIEKTLISCNNCVLCCDKCKICIHTYKCSCMNNIIYLNICKHIHACAITETVGSLPKDENQILPPTQNVVDNVFKQTIKESDLNTKTNEDIIKNKLETIYGMVNRAQLEETSTSYIIEQCDNIISKLTNNTIFKEITTNGSNKRKIKLQEKWFPKKKCSSQQHTLSSLESKHIRQSFLNINKETLNISTTATFDHSYI